MKTLGRSNRISGITCSLALVASFASMSCGILPFGHTSDDSAGPSPETPEAHQANETAPTVVPETKASQAIDVGGLTMNEVSLNLPGDFRVQQVERDSSGSFYVSLISNAKKADNSTTPAFAILKLDKSGKEVWRFPTSENAAAPQSSPDTVGPFFIGSLANIHVTDSGDVLLIGIRDWGVKISSDTSVVNLALANSNFPASKIAGAASADHVGNVAFIAALSGAGTTADSPRILSYARLATPVWWTPRSISRQADGSITIQSDTGAIGDGYVQQYQHVDMALSKVIDSACFATRTPNPASGKDRLVAVASSASTEIVTSMTKAPTMAVDGADLSTVVKSLSGDTGRCWDAIGSRMMPTGDNAFKILQPSILASGQAMTSKVESLNDIVTGGNLFSEYDSDNSVVLGSQFAPVNLATAVATTAESTIARSFSSGSELAYMGIGSPDLLGRSILSIGNQRSSDPKSWKIELGSSNLRSPASLDMTMSPDSRFIFAAWTDVHFSGETLAGNRALRIAQIPMETKSLEKTKIVSLDVPAKTGHVSYSSVRMTPYADNGVAIFATAGTPDGVSKAPLLQMKYSTLLVGFLK